MIRIGLTGGIGSGKSTVAKLFQQLGAPIIDTDLIARELAKKTGEAFSDITQHFGPSILTPEGEIDRRQLRQWVFDQPEDRVWLENCLHPRILNRVRRAIESLNAPYCILVIPLLIESKQTQPIDRILVVDVPPSLQITRATQRDKTSSEAVKKILAAQATREERLAFADDVIDNSQHEKSLKPQVEKLHQRYLALATP